MRNFRTEICAASLSPATRSPQRHMEIPRGVACELSPLDDRLRRIEAIARSAPYLILEDSLLPVQSSAATTGPNADGMGQSDRGRRTYEDIG
jgi:hypothetical protein